MKEITSYNLHELEPVFDNAPARISDVHFTHLTLPLDRLGELQLIDCRFDSVTFTGELRKPLTITGANLEGCTFDDSKLTNLYVRASNVCRTSFRQTALTNCCFQDCRFERIDFRCLILEQSKLFQCQMIQSQFDYVEASATFFSNVDFLHPNNTISFAKWKESQFIACNLPEAFLDPSLSAMEQTSVIEPGFTKSRPKSDTEKAMEVKEEKKPAKRSAPLKKDENVEPVKKVAPKAEEPVPETKIPADDGSRFSFIPLPSEPTENKPAPEASKEKTT